MKKIALAIVLLALVGCSHIQKEDGSLYDKGFSDGARYMLQKNLERPDFTVSEDQWDGYIRGFLRGQLVTANLMGDGQAEDSIKRCAPILGYFYDADDGQFKKISH